MGAGQPKENLEMEDSLLSPSRLPLISWFDRFSIDREPEKKQTKAKGRGAEGQRGRGPNQRFEATWLLHIYAQTLVRLLIIYSSCITQ